MPSTRMPSAQPSSSQNAADAAEGRQEVADRIGLERKHALQAERSEIEQTAVEIKVPEMEHRLIDQTASVVGDDQFGVTLLNLFVVGNAVVAEGESDEDDQS